MHDLELSTKSLLGLIIGRRPAHQLWRGSLMKLFLGEDLPEEARLRLTAVRELVRRWMLEELRAGPILNSKKAIREYLRVHYAGVEREVFSVIFLCAEHRLIAAENLFLGTVDMVTVHVREIVKRSLALNASSIVIAHNHPTGDAMPSKLDGDVTQRIVKALDTVDIQVMDHMIVGLSEVLSFSERGLL